MAITTMEQVRLEALRRGMPEVAMVAQHMVLYHPVFGELRWDQVEGDVYAYHTRMGTSTAPHFNPDGAYVADAAERLVPRTAYIRPMGGMVETPYMSRAIGTPADRIKWKAEAIVNQYMASFVSGGFITGGTVSGITAGLCTFSSAGPAWDLVGSGRGRGFCVIRLRWTGAATMASIKAADDTAFGTEVSLEGLGAPGVYVVQLASSNPYYWVNFSFNTALLPSANEVGMCEMDTAATLAFDGVGRLCFPDMNTNVATATGENLSLNHLDEIASTLRGSGRLVGLMNPRTMRSARAQARTMGGASINEAATSDPRVFEWAGIKWIEEPLIPTNITFGGTPNCTYLVAFNADTGLRGLYSTGDRAEADGMTVGGISVRQIGEDSTSDHVRTKVIGYLGLALHNREGLTIKNGIRN